MKKFIKAKLEKIEPVREDEKNTNIKCILLFNEEGISRGLPTLTVVAVKSFVEVDRGLIGKEIIMEVKIGTFGTGFKSNLYYQCLALHKVIQ